MICVYVYLMAAMADWEIGYFTAELNSKRFFKKDAHEIVLKTVAITKDPVRTMGGLTVIPDMTVSEIEVGKGYMLVLPGADTWEQPVNQEILFKAKEMLDAKDTVCGICGATVALAKIDAFEGRKHTSNGAEFLQMFAPEYKGRELYVDADVVVDKNLITANSVSARKFAKEIFKKLGVFEEDVLEAWDRYFKDGRPEDFFAMMKGKI